ncbi:DNA ligase 4-like isoform X2 [Hibiscus syriacus]|uniref:DNA ligase 4-like isoform X2 n=1 Tax=Hibiscus syriacus TaxID=106335 RepID=UPI00192328CA|nr:DNA ligase 4-like isoform X2 [Hibiscus syriacus]
MTEEVKLTVLASLFTWIQRIRPSARKRSKFRKFLDTFCKPSDYFSAMRLILPSLDRERGTYGLKESVLALCLIDALGMARDSPDALRLINWRKGGANTGANAGNFALVASEVLQRRQGTASGGLTIKELNDLLDRLASAENRAEKTAILSTLINKTNAQEMKWVIMIILKDLKLGISEKSIFQEFHPDAEDLFNVTCDLKLVCEKLRDRSQRHKRQDIEVGKAVRPQLAMRVRDPVAAWKKLHGKEVVVECKFDGDRIQIHKNGIEIRYYSRNFLDHYEYGHGMSNVIAQNILVDRCILDGEMLVWDSTSNRFAEFGSNQEIAKAAKDGLDSDRQLCYVAFDVLYVGDTSVIHQSLKERHELLKKVVKPLKGRLEILVPNGGLNSHCPPGEPCWSSLAHSVNDVERFFKETIENRDEGIVIKDLSSKWEPSDRSGKWLKLKPDYIRAGSDLDVLVIGGYYGSGRRGGEVAQFLVGLADRQDPNAYPRRFLSFCRVGTGLTDDELETVAKKLKPYFRKYEYPKKMQPSFYQVTNHSKERPDVWIESPEKSIILSITSDIRTIQSEVFAAPYSLRFPRIDRVRYDKPWHECLDVQSFVELVHSSNGTTQKETERENQHDSKTKHKERPRKAEKTKVSIVPSHFIRTDTSRVKGESLVFSNHMFYFVNVPPTHSLDSLHKMIVELGGKFSMNLNNSVTHCVAAESKGIKYKAAKRHGEIIHYSWVLDCCSQKKLIPLQPKYFLFLSESSRMKLQQEVDEYSDPYYWDLDLADLKQLLNNIQRSENSKTIDYYRGKYCPNDKWSLFHSCSVYFYCSPQFLKDDWQVLLKLAMRRLKHEVLMGGGKISENLNHATHVVVLSIPGLDVDIDSIIKSSFEEKNLLWKKGLHVLGSRWLENCLEHRKKLQEDQYSLKPFDFEETNFLERKSDRDPSKTMPEVTSASHECKKEESAAKDHLEKSISLVTPDYGKRKRRPASKNTNKGKAVVSRAPRVPRRRGKMSVKINEDGSEESDSDDKTNEGIEKDEENTEHNGTAGGEDFEFHQNQVAEENAGIKWPDKVSDTVMSETKDDRASIKWPDKASDTVMYETNNDQGSKSDDKFDYVEPDEGNMRHETSKSEKVVLMSDPVQAMLLDMIPSLGIKQVETTNSVVENEKPRADNDAKVSVVEDEKGDADIIAPTPKKKKVSYKDVAGELLKDW